MRLTVSQLRKIIKEEVSRMLREEEAPLTPEEVLQAAKEAIMADPELAAAVASVSPRELLADLRKINKQDSKLSEVAYVTDPRHDPYGEIESYRNSPKMPNTAAGMLATALIGAAGMAHGSPVAIAAALISLGITGMTAIVEAAAEQEAKARGYHDPSEKHVDYKSDVSEARTNMRRLRQAGRRY